MFVFRLTTLKERKFILDRAAAEVKTDIERKISEISTADKNGTSMFQQGRLARLQHQLDPADLNLPIQTIEHALNNNPENLSAHLQALNAMFDIVADSVVHNKNNKEQIDLTPALLQIQIISDRLAGFQTEPFELSQTFYLLNELSGKFWSYEKGFKPAREGDMPPFSLQNVKMPNSGEPLEEYYQKYILRPLLKKSIDEALADQPLNIARNLKFLRVMFKELEAYKKEEDGGLLTPGHVIYNTDPATKLLLDGMWQACINLRNPQAFASTTSSIEQDLKDLRLSIEEFTRAPLVVSTTNG